MSSRFCTTCNNILTAITTADEFRFKCVSCNKNYAPNTEHTMLYEHIVGPNFATDIHKLLNASRDPVNPKVFKDCKTCDSKIVKQIQLGEDMKIINVCIKCDNKWLEGVD
jgi:DNA-directed RNA polymerase subunit M/transcription elongation factor TFIIS